jgi:hypothetical protein
MFQFRWPSVDLTCILQVAGPENACTLQSRIMRTAAESPSIVETIEENNGEKKWQGRSTQWKTMTRL